MPCFDQTTKPITENDDGLAGVSMGGRLRRATKPRAAVAFTLLLATFAVVAFRFYVKSLPDPVQRSPGESGVSAGAGQPSPLFKGKPGLSLNDPKAFQGYTLLAPLSSTKTYLIDMQGRVVGAWESDCTPALGAYLL